MFNSVVSRTTSVATAGAYTHDYNLSDPSSPVYSCAIQVIYTATSLSHASFTGTRGGIDTAITITADNAGTIGNSVLLSFNGVKTVNQVISDWNIANPSNTITLTAGDGTQVGTNGETIQLMGGGSTDFASTTISLQASNDGVNFSELSGRTISPTSPGNTVWDLGVISFKVLRISKSSAVDSINLTVIFNGVNLI